jgi:hypothetical protein
MLELAPDPEVIEAALHHKFLPYAAFARYDVSNETLRRWLRGEIPPTVLVRRLADCRALKKPRIRLLLRRWARKTSPMRRCALLAACALLHGDSGHVAGKAALRLLESQRLIDLLAAQGPSTSRTSVMARIFRR